MKNPLSQKDMMELLDKLYQACSDGIANVSPPVSEMANDYLKMHSKPEIAARSMMKYQIAKCTTSGVITGFGGVITLPVSIPANISSVLYIQMRMIAATAYMAGYDLHSDQVQTLVYACLAGVSVNQVVKQAGIKVGEKVAMSMIKKVPGKTLTKINQKVGFRLVTKFGEKGIVNLGKLIPGVGAVISGGMDFAETRVIGSRAYKMFFEGDFSCSDQNGEEIVLNDSDIIEE